MHLYVLLAARLGEVRQARRRARLAGRDALDQVGVQTGHQHGFHQPRVFRVPVCLEPHRVPRRRAAATPGLVSAAAAAAAAAPRRRDALLPATSAADAPEEAGFLKQLRELVPQVRDALQRAEAQEVPPGELHPRGFPERFRVHPRGVRVEARQVVALVLGEHSFGGVRLVSLLQRRHERRAPAEHRRDGQHGRQTPQNRAVQQHLPDAHVHGQRREVLAQRSQVFFFVQRPDLFQRLYG